MHEPRNHRATQPGATSGPAVTPDAAYVDALMRFEALVDADPPGGRLRMREILRAAAEATGVSGQEIVGRSRSPEICAVRHEVMLIAHEQGYSLPMVGRMLGGRDHTTVLNGVRRAREKRERMAEAGS